MNRSAAAAPDFAFAETKQGELNNRQRQILDLLVAGRTNGEIAETLGISFDGAKWNVSEILTKLGLETREDAAAYWRWRRAPHRRARRLLRGLVPGTALKVAGASAIVAAAGIGVLFFWLAVSGGDDGGPLFPPRAGSYHIEGTYFQRRDIAAWKLQPLADADRGTFSISVYDDTHVRVETTNAAPRLDALDTLVLLDGKSLHSSDGKAYQIVPLALLSPAGAAGPWQGPEGVGLPRASTPEELVRQLSSPSLDGSGFPVPRAALAGEDMMFGRKVAVIEFGPTWVNGEFHTSGGTGRMWMDLESGIILKVTREGNDGSEMARAEVTRFDWEPAMPASVFKAHPPADAQTIGASGSPPEIETPPPPGTFLSPPPLPDGYTEAGSGRGGAEVHVAYVRGSDSLVFDQRVLPQGLPEGLRTGKHVSLPGGVAGYLQDIGGNRVLAFAKGDVSVLITATALSDRELVSLAEAMLR